MKRARKTRQHHKSTHHWHFPHISLPHILHYAFLWTGLFSLILAYAYHDYLAALWSVCLLSGAFIARQFGTFASVRRLWRFTIIPLVAAASLYSVLVWWEIIVPLFLIPIPYGWVVYLASGLFLVDMFIPLRHGLRKMREHHVKHPASKKEVSIKKKAEKKIQPEKKESKKEHHSHLKTGIPFVPILLLFFGGVIIGWGVYTSNQLTNILGSLVALIALMGIFKPLRWRMMTAGASSVILKYRKEEYQLLQKKIAEETALKELMKQQHEKEKLLKKAELHRTQQMQQTKQSDANLKKIEEAEQKRIARIQKQIEFIRRRREQLTKEGEKQEKRTAVISTGKKYHSTESHETDLDILIDMLHEYGSLTFPEIADLFGIDTNTVELWSTILEENSLARIHYPALGSPELKV